MSDLQRAIDALTDLQNANESMYQETYEVYEERDDYQEDTETFETALTALRDMMRRREGCAMCRGIVRAEKIDMILAYKADGGIAGLSEISCNYCPRCGRSMVSDDPQDYIDTPEEWARRAGVRENRTTNETKRPESCIREDAIAANESRDTLGETGV